MMEVTSGGLLTDQKVAAVQASRLKRDGGTKAKVLDGIIKLTEKTVLGGLTDFNINAFHKKKG